MVNYVLTRFTSALESSVDAALADLVTQLNTVDATKTIRMATIVKEGSNGYRSVAIYDT